MLLLSSLKGEGEPRFPSFSEWIGERTGLIAIKEGVSLMAREPLFDTRKRPSHLEKSVSFILLKASPSPSKGGDVLPGGCFFDLKCKVHNSKI